MTTLLSSRIEDRRPGGLRLRSILLAGGVALMLAGCASVDQRTVGSTVPAPGDYHQRHPITFGEMIETFDVPVSVDTAILTEPVRGNIRGFAQKFLASDGNVIALVTPKGSPNARTALARARDIRRVLIASGVNPRAIQHRVYDAAPGEFSPPIRLAYAHIGAHTAPCGQWPNDVTVNEENSSYFNFGCATQQNLAAIVSNPLDLLYPRATTPPDTERRSTVLDNYAKGGPTQGDYSKEKGGTIAQGVGN